MAFEETVTIINNSGKIISTGRQLLNIWKEASTKYTDRRQAIKTIRKGQTNSQPTSPTTPTPGIKRAQTFSAPTRVPDAISEASSDASEEQDFVPPLRKRISYYPDVDADPKARAARLYLEDDNKSFISLRSSSTRASKSKKRSSGSSRRGGSSVVSSSAGSSSAPSTVFSAASSSSTGSALTASALRAHNANPPPKYRSPYAETAPRDMAVSRPAFSVVDSEATSRASEATARPQTVAIRPTAVSEVHSEEEDDLAYGSLPPDLAKRDDLVEWEEPIELPEDPAAVAKIIQDEKEVKSLIRTVESLLDEAHCIHHTATGIISHLQENPEAAAAVALTLAELSTILGKLSPGILTLIRSGSPAVFALLASPQFLIGATAAVGVTVVMFGGWKIIKKWQGEAPVAKTPMPVAATAPPMVRSQTMPAIAPRQSSLVGAPEQTMLLDDVTEVSGIERWMRGVPESVVSDDGESEFIPHSRKNRHSASAAAYSASIDPDDSISNVGFNPRSHRSVAGSSVSKSSRTSRRDKERTRDSASSVSRSKSVSVASSSYVSSHSGSTALPTRSKSIKAPVSSGRAERKAAEAAKKLDKEREKERDRAKSVVSTAKSSHSTASAKSSAKSTVSVKSSSSSASKKGKDEKKDKEKGDKEDKEKEKKKSMLKQIFHRKEKELAAVPV